MKDKRGDKLSDVQAYMKASHDVSNQLQLLSIYAELGDQQKVNTLITEWMKTVQDEQKFLSLKTPRFISSVIHTRMNTKSCKFTFRIEDEVNMHHDVLLRNRWQQFTKQYDETINIINIIIRQQEAVFTAFVDDTHVVSSNVLLN